MKFLPALLLLVVVACAPRASATPTKKTPMDPFKAELLDWKKTRFEKLKKDYGWFSVVGLEWLKKGENAVGSDAKSDIKLPAHAAPPFIGTLTLKDNQVTLTPEPSAMVSLGDEILSEPRVLKADSAEGGPDIILMGPVKFYVIERNGRYGVRIKDPESAARKAFSGLEYYPSDKQWRVRATLQPYEKPREVEVLTVIDTVQKMMVPGLLVFTIDGQEVSLEPFQSDPNDPELFIIFLDDTAGTETYPPGRYLYADLKEDGTVALDFNRAYNPPCAFTDYATCPLPPQQNILKTRIEAGELLFKGTRVGIAKH